MRRSHIIAFVALVLVPVLALLWLASRVADGDAQIRRHQFDQLITDRLSDIRDRTQAAVDELERQLLATLEATTDADAFADLGRTEPFVRQAFSVNQDGALTFPSADGASREELDFIERTKTIWNRSSVLRGPPDMASQELVSAHESKAAKKEAAADLESYRPPGDDILSLAKTQRSGWLTWYWREGLHLLLWLRRDNQAGAGVVGVEVERIALLARIVAKLPTTENADSRLVLVSSRGEPVHQWGLYEPSENEAPVGQLALGFPLDTWSLEYFAAPAQRSAFLSRGRTSAVLGVSAVVVALLTLALFLFRDVRRRLGEAAERVNFVTRVSHELKTPLTNIRLYAELLDHELGEHEDGPVRPASRDRLSVVVAESQRLTRLINNILTFSKHKRDQLTVSESWIELDALLASVLEQFEPALREQGVEPHLRPGLDEPIFADADAIGQIIANLLGNVLKYATAGEYVEVSSALEDEWVCIAVTDRGPGIKERDAKEIFKPFVRLSDSLSEGASGTGIGLSIARELARLHGGDLSYSANADGSPGARFELRVPRKVKGAPA